MKSLRIAGVMLVVGMLAQSVFAGNMELQEWELYCNANVEGKKTVLKAKTWSANYARIIEGANQEWQSDNISIFSDKQTAIVVVDNQGYQSEPIAVIDREVTTQGRRYLISGKGYINIPGLGKYPAECGVLDN